MAQIDIQVMFDSATILQKYGGNTSPSTPQGISGDLVYMVTAQDNAVSGTDGSAELRVNARTEDIITWRESSVGTDYSVIFYQFSVNPAGLISSPTLNQATVTMPYPNPANPLQPLMQTVQDYFWLTVVENPGTVTYHFCFMVVARDGTIQGYYNWDPFINITS